MRILPAGVPRGLSQFGHRLRAAAANTPLFFIGAVIAIAVVFRVGIGVVKPAAAAEEVAEKPGAPAYVGKVTLPSSMATVTPSVTASASAKPASAAPAVGRDPAENTPRPMVRGKKPRNHGKR